MREEHHQCKATVRYHVCQNFYIIERTGSQPNSDEGKQAEWANAVAEKVWKLENESEKLKKQVSAEAEHARGCNIIFNGITYEELIEKAAPTKIRDFLLDKFINNPKCLNLNISPGNLYIKIFYLNLIYITFNIISEFISDAHRIQSKKEPKPIIIQFVRQIDAKSVKNNAWKMKGINDERKKAQSKQPLVVILDHHEPEKNKKIGYLNSVIIFNLAVIYFIRLLIIFGLLLISALL